MTAEQKTQIILSHFETYAYLPDIAPMITAAIWLTEQETREQCAQVAEKIWDRGQHGAHGGEQALRTARAIRALGEER